MNLTGGIGADLRPIDLAKDSVPARLGICELAGILNIHLAMEDQALYPHLLDHGDLKVRTLAQRYVDEMGDLNVKFKAYFWLWTAAQQIEDDPNGFIRETSRILGALTARIYCENNELYPLLEREK